MRRLIGTIAAILTGSASVATACGFHNYVPQPTLVDRLIDSEHIVLARQDPENPFRYKVMTALEGGADNVHLPHLVDSVSRRRLTVDPDAHVLFAREGAYGPWQRVAFIDDEMRPVLNTVVTQLSEWQLGEDQNRFQTFAAYLNHPDKRVRTLALRELDRADYGFLISNKIPIDKDQILAEFNIPEQRELRAIRVLLLGLAGGDGIRDRLEQGLDAAIDYENSLTGAYATALIELDGPDRASTLAQRYLTDPKVPEASKEALIEALALHSQYGDAQMNSVVADVVADILRQAPQLAPAVARQFGARQVWSQRDALATLVRDGSLNSPLDVLAISQYVAVAGDLTGSINLIEGENSDNGVFE